MALEVAGSNPVIHPNFLSFWLFGIALALQLGACSVQDVPGRCSVIHRAPDSFGTDGAQACGRTRQGSRIAYSIGAVLNTRTSQVALAAPQPPVTAHHEAVHIIESLRARDLKTGQRLRDWLQSVVKASGLAVPVRFWREPTKAGLLDRLRLIAAEVRNTGQAPIIDLQTHGDLDRLQVTSCERVTWSDLKAPLIEINVACGLNLLVLVGACDGEALLRVLEAHDRAPVWGLIGPREKVREQAIEEAHAAFYATLLSTRDGGAAVRAMNATAGAPDSMFRFFGAEWFFREVMRAYIKEHATEAQLVRRREKLVAEADQKAKRDGRSPEDRARLSPVFAAAIDDRLRDHQGLFDGYKRRFFLEDLYPEHAARFAVSLADCLADQEP